MNLLMSVSRNPVALGLFFALALTGCASKNRCPTARVNLVSPLMVQPRDRNRI